MTLRRRTCPGVLLLFAGAAAWAADKSDCFRSHAVPGSGAGYFMTAADFAPLSLHAGIEAADMNGDGAVDLVVVADGAMPAGVYAGTVSPDGLPNHALGPAHYLYGSGGSVLGPAELSPNVIVGSSKGDPDGVRSPGGDLGWFENDGWGHFQLRLVEDTSGGTPRPARLYGAKQVAVADLDNDGDPDIVVWCGDGRRTGLPPADWGAARVTWFENQLPSGFAQHDLVQGVDPAVGAVADMDGDGAPDIVVADRFGGSPSLYWIRNLGVGNASSFTPADIHPVRVDGKTYTASHVLAVRCADLDRDGRMDLVLIHGTPQAELLALIQKPDGTFRQLTIDPDMTPGNALAVGDVNRDRIPDIAAGNGPVKLYVSKGASPHWSPVELAGNQGRTGVVDLRLADMNGDKRPDLLVLFKGPDGQTPASLSGVWMNTAGPWQYIPILEEDARDPSGGEAGGGLAVADVDQDGDLDIVRAHRDFPLALYENVWNTQRLFRVTATAQQPGFTQRVTTYVSTHPNGTPARPIGQSTTSQ